MENISFVKELAQLDGPGLMMRGGGLTKKLNNAIYFPNSPVNILSATALDEPMKGG